MSYEVGDLLEANLELAIEQACMVVSGDRLAKALRRLLDLHCPSYDSAAAHRDAELALTGWAECLGRDEP